MSKCLFISFAIITDYVKIAVDLFSTMFAMIFVIIYYAVKSAYLTGEGLVHVCKKVIVYTRKCVSEEICAQKEKL